MRKMKLNKQEKQIENALLAGEYRPVAKSEFEEIAHAISKRKKDAILHIRVNSEDLRYTKQKAKRLGIKYQTFISEIIHRVAHS